jgi:purine nucleosidase
LQEALAAAPLTLVSLGPLTNIAAALRERPALQANVARLVAVMGRRPGHLFHPAEGASGGILFGHGPVFRDFNFDQDREAATSVLEMGLPMTLMPYDAARELTLTGTDLGQLEARGDAAAWVASRARAWLDFWKEGIGKDGFYPFDLLAGAYVIEPRLFDCARSDAWVSRDPRLWNLFYDPDALLVGFGRAQPPDASATGRVIYCPQVSPDLHRWLMSRLGASPKREGASRGQAVHSTSKAASPPRG